MGRARQIFEILRVSRVIPHEGRRKVSAAQLQCQPIPAPVSAGRQARVDASTAAARRGRRPPNSGSRIDRTTLGRDATLAAGLLLSSPTSEPRRPRLARLRHWWTTASGLFPLTPLGVLATAGGAAGLRWLAFARVDLVLLVVGYAAVALSALATVGSLLGAVRVAWALRRLPPAAERDVETGLELPTGAALPRLLWIPFVRLRWRWIAPEAVVSSEPKGLRRVESASLRRRGRIAIIERELVVEDAFGLSRVRWRHRQSATLVVHPHVGALRAMPTLLAMTGGEDFPHPMGVAEGDRIELRRYEPGDSARFVHWKVFSRTRRLMVRMPEKALTRSRRIIAYLVAGPDDEASAAAARVAIESGALGDEWTFGADGGGGEARDVADARARIVRSVDAEGASGLASFIALAESRGPASLVVFVPPRPGPWLDRTLASLRGREARVRVVIATDGLRAESARPTWKRVFLDDVTDEGTPASDLEEVVRRFRALRCEVVLVDRARGRRLGDAHRRALLALEGLGGHA